MQDSCQTLKLHALAYVTRSKKRTVVNHTFHAINATLCPVNRPDASRVGSQLDASETVAMEGFDIGASLDIVSSTLMAKWRHKSRVYVR